MIEITDFKFDCRTVEVSGKISEEEVRTINSDIGLEKIRVYGEKLEFRSGTGIDNQDFHTFYFLNVTIPLHVVIQRNCFSRVRSLSISNSPGLISTMDSNLTISLLEDLTVAGQSLSSTDVLWLGRQNSVTFMGMHFTDLSDNTLCDATRGSAKTLKWLGLTNTFVTLSHGIEATFPNVVHLSIDRTNVGDESVNTIRRCFPSLKRLGITGTRLSRMNVKTLAEWGQLDVLDTDYKDLSFSKTVGPYSSHE